LAALGIDAALATDAAAATGGGILASLLSLERVGSDATAWREREREKSKKAVEV
jgi:hypothetical protein